MTLLIAALTVAAIHAKAQDSNESQIKILCTDTPGVLKLIHAITTSEPVLVKFSDDQGMVFTDKIKGSFPRGLAKRYDVSQLSSHKFRMEISTPELTVIYRIVPSKDKQKFDAYLEKSIHNYDVIVASTK